MKTICGCIVSVLLLLAPACLPAEQALIIFASGAEIEIHDAAGSRVPLTDLIGHPLRQGDILITGEDSFVEIQLPSTRNVIKIAENTTFQLEQMESKRESVFQVFYGSVRARVQKLARAEDFKIRGGDAIAGVRGTDFGLNVLVDREQEDADPVTEVYCFAGEIRVKPSFLPPDTPTAQPASGEGELVLSAGEMVRVSRSAPEAAYEKIPVAPEIEAYWQSNDFQGRLLSGKEMSLQAPEAYRLEENRRKLTMAGGGLLAAGLIMEFSGVISLAAGRNADISDPFRREALQNSGIALVCGGSFILTTSLVTLLRSAALARRTGRPAAAF
jgi:hypothetical protein